jgi:hypothetical protein
MWRWRILPQALVYQAITVIPRGGQAGRLFRTSENGPKMAVLLTLQIDVSTIVSAEH